jgi:outer membrane protein assembly factor BamD
MSMMSAANSLLPRRMRVAVLLVLCMFMATACSWLPEVGKDETAGWSAERLYKEAHESMTDGNYTRAAKLFDSLEGRFPYGRFAQQAIIEGAYSNYRMGETATAAAACDRFIRTYPNHPNVDYALYLKGLVYFREDQGLMGYVYELDLAERDPKAMRDSFAAFKELVARFPESKYAVDGQDRLKYLANAMAMHEVYVARYYYNRGAYVAAADRAQGSLLTYPRQPANEDALEILVRSYDKLGLPDLRDDSRRVLEKTYPASKYLAAAPPKPWWKLW